MVVAACTDGSSASTPGATGAETTPPPPTTTPVLTITTTTAPATTTTTSAAVTTTEVDEAFEIVITVIGGEVEGGGRIEVPLDGEVRLTVTADVSDEVHIHGYDIFFDVEPGVAATHDFTADIPGIFDVELEANHTLLVALEIAP